MFAIKAKIETRKHDQASQELCITIKGVRILYHPHI